ncbi:MAG: hypothetical protein JXE07_00030 [Candidatus Aminicenantes bacterium]|nr:hypothetical protein [Candidatus Aminicenantes bacterium]
MKRKEIAWLIVGTVAVIALFFGADSQDRMGELSKRMEELGKKLEACGGNIECMKKVMAELQAVSAEYAKLAQAVSGTPLIPGQQESPTCENFFRPGWSCLPVKMTASYRNERKSFDSYCDPPGILPCNRREFVSFQSVYALTAEGNGILTYTKDFVEFQVFVRSALAKTRLTAFEGFKRWRTETPIGSGRYRFEQRNFPMGSCNVDIPAGLSIDFPAEEGAPTNVFFVPAHTRTTDDWYPTERGDNLGPTMHSEDAVSVEIVVPEAMRAAATSGRFVRTYRWRSLDTDGKSTSDNRLDLTLEIGEAPRDEPGVLAVSPGDGFSSSRTDPKKSFEPSSKIYTLRNAGKQALNYSVSKKADWLNLDTTAGSLGPGQSAAVTVSVNVPVADKLEEDTVKDTLAFTNTTDGNGNTSRPAELTVGEEQDWQVFLTGYEIDEMNPYWKITTKVRGAIRFDYKLRGEFTITKKKGKWQYKKGVITLADVGLSNLYEPLKVWLVKPLNCRNCSQVVNLKGTPLSGRVDGNEVRLFWGKKRPQVEVEAKIVVPCTPMPDCAQWKSRLFISEEFMDRINDVFLPLKHEGVVTPPKPIISPQGSRWISYTFILRRLK